jgi:aspartate/methionine/tyrosine aminotransferase
MSEFVNPLEQARRRAIHNGRIRTLANTSFSAVHIRWPEELYRTAWDAWRREPAYTPTGRGGISARTALAHELSREGILSNPDDLVLTAGSSISYHLLFSVLRNRKGNPASTVALPTPGYPLFEGILAPLSMEPVWYRCPPENGFLPDHREIERLVRRAEPPAALVLISPNNPTGVTYPDETVATIVDVCTTAGVTVILDEVFSLFRTTDTGCDLVTHDTARGPAPVVHLNGVSKLCAAPEIKLGWIMVSGGDSAERMSLTEDLDTAHDTYLSLSGFAEAALKPFVTGETARSTRSDIRERVADVRTAMIREIDSTPGWQAAEASSGIHIPLRLDPIVAAERFGTLDDETIAVELVNQTGVFLHPGYYYGLDYPRFSGGPWFVVSALTDETTRTEAFDALRRML